MGPIGVTTFDKCDLDYQRIDLRLPLNLILLQ